MVKQLITLFFFANIYNKNNYIPHEGDSVKAMLSDDSHLLICMSLYCSPNTLNRYTLRDQKGIAVMIEHDIWDSVMKDVEDSTLLPLGLLGKVNCHVMNTIRQSYQEVHILTKWGFLSITINSTNLWACTWAPLEANTPAIVKPSDDQHQRHLDSNLMRNSVLINI